MGRGNVVCACLCVCVCVCFSVKLYTTNSLSHKHPTSHLHKNTSMHTFSSGHVQRAHPPSSPFLLHTTENKVKKCTQLSFTRSSHITSHHITSHPHSLKDPVESKAWPVQCEGRPLRERGEMERVFKNVFHAFRKTLKQNKLQHHSVIPMSLLTFSRHHHPSLITHPSPSSLFLTSANAVSAWSASRIHGFVSCKTNLSDPKSSYGLVCLCVCVCVCVCLCVCLCVRC